VAALTRRGVVVRDGVQPGEPADYLLAVADATRESLGVAGASGDGPFLLRHWAAKGERMRCVRSLPGPRVSEEKGWGKFNRNRGEIPVGSDRWCVGRVVAVRLVVPVRIVRSRSR
jgi:hypothetical protein